jgi:hypothetical protein
MKAQMRIENYYYIMFNDKYFILHYLFIEYNDYILNSIYKLKIL